MLRANSSDSIAAAPESMLRGILVCSRDIVSVFAWLANLEFYGTCAGASKDIPFEWLPPQRLIARRSTKSRQRHEKPHSLSYQATTLTQFVPTTCVNGASTVEEFEFQRKSTETSSSSLSASMPFIGPSTAFRKAALTRCAEGGFSVRTVRSTTLTSGVGTRSE